MGFLREGHLKMQNICLEIEEELSYQELGHSACVVKGLMC